jgi:RimJ/RimL family protein N-acetyltransferase
MRSPWVGRAAPGGVPNVAAKTQSLRVDRIARPGAAWLRYNRACADEQPVNLQPLTLTGRVVRLEPMSLDHVPALTVAGRNDDIWRYMPYPQMRTEADMRGWVEDMLRRQARGTDLPFVVYHLAAGRPIGATRYMEIQPAHRSLEIGGTWYAAEFQRTAVNTECKYLLLSHAFEQLGCIRVQIKTDLRNERSQRAIERLGAVREGVLRNNMIMPDGHVRSSVYYSILADEWPAVKARLEEKLKG